MNSAASERYHARMQRVLAYIEAHIDDDPDLGTLTIDALGSVAAFSKFHFHRQFTELFGIAPTRYVQLVRLKRASFRLAFRNDTSVTQIAHESGYASSEAFARAFRQRVGQAPAAFRDAPDWTPWQQAFGPLDTARSKAMIHNYQDDNIEIVDFPETHLAVMSHRGDPALLAHTLRRFIAWRKQAGLRPKTSATFNLLYGDPEATAPEDFRIDLCAEAGHPLTFDGDDVVEGLIPAGRCAMLRTKGAIGSLKPAISFLYADWLPRSGEELRDFPIFLQRVRFYPDVPEHEAVTDVYLPLK